MLLFTLSRQVGFTLLITKSRKIKKKYINVRDHQNSAMDIVANTGSQVIESKNLCHNDNFQGLANF